MTTPNTELAYLTLDHIDADPESWNQSGWACGTVACFGGWAAKLAGCQLGQLHDGVVGVIDGPEELINLDAERAANHVLGIKSGWVRHNNENDDEWLYDVVNTREDLGRLVAEIFGPRPGGEPR